MLGCDATPHRRLQNIPPNQNTFAELNAHFSKFGTIVRITVGQQSNGIPDAKVNSVESTDCC